MMHYLSRSFVEFGPFPAAEILSFNQRGLLKNTDYVRGEGKSDWTHVNDWAASQTPVKAAPAVKATPAVKAPTAAKSKPAPAVKAAT
ncbi:MAG: hypothetical protein ABL974_12015, partial [Prosthecobacter sp.]